MTEIVVDGSNAVLGRLASNVAKRLMRGDTVFIVNAQNVVVSGNPDVLYKYYKHKIERGDPLHGPFFPRRPDMIVKRTVRGMLPYKKKPGKDAFNRLKVYLSVPKTLEKRKITRMGDADNKLECKYTKLENLSLKLGAKRT